MGFHPINLTFRFVLELCALAALAYWGWIQHSGLLRYLLAAGLPLVAAVMWGTFAVPGDRSRSGRAPVPVPGLVRLALELAFFAAATWLLYDAGQATLALIFGAATVVHYVLSYDRIAWLLRAGGKAR
jgi:hypothetical protein